MIVFMRNRESARDLAKRRLANGHPAKVVDNGKDYKENGVKARFGVSLR